MNLGKTMVLKRSKRLLSQQLLSNMQQKERLFFFFSKKLYVETVSDLILGGSKITADGDCSHEIKRHLLLGRKVMTNLDSILKSRHYFANKGLSGQGYGFSSGHVWM